MLICISMRIDLELVVGVYYAVFPSFDVSRRLKYILCTHTLYFISISFLAGGNLGLLEKRDKQ